MKIAFACCFGLGLGTMMGYQLHEQTTPAAEVAQITLNNQAQIRALAKEIEKCSTK